MNRYINKFFAVLATVFFALSVHSAHSSSDTTPCSSQECKSMFSKFKKAAKYGSVEGQIITASMLYSGYGTEQDLKESFKWYRKAAKQGAAEASYQLGLLYLRGEGTEQDTRQGIKWLARSANQGVKEAYLRLANIYIVGALVEQDLQEAQRWLSLGDRNQEPNSQFKLGLLHESGLLGEPNLEQAVELYKKSASSNRSAYERLVLLSKLPGNEQILDDLNDVPNEFERITITAPDISEMLAFSLKSIDASGTYIRRKTCSRIANRECTNVAHVTEVADINYILRDRWY